VKIARNDTKAEHLLSRGAVNVREATFGKRQVRLEACRR
jgi:hypothetical protein